MIQLRDQQITIFESHLYRTTTTVLLTDELILLVDPNWLPGEVNEIRNFVSKHKGRRKLYLLFTHSDYDHIIAYGAFPGATTIASQAFVAQPLAQKQIRQILDFDAQFYLNRDYPIVYPQISHAFHSDGQRLELEGGLQLYGYAAPGHTDDGLFTVVEPYGIFIAGDYLSNIEFPFIYHSLEAYEQTMAKAGAILEKHEITLLIPGHGDCTSDRAEMRQRIEESNVYLQQLRRQVQSGEPFPTKSLWERYRFRKGMESYHRNNLKLARKALIT